MPFQKGNKLSVKNGGAKPGAGRPTKAQLLAREQALIAREKALAIWEKQIQAREAELARRYVEQAFVDNKVLLDLRKTRVPDAPREVEVNGQLNIASINIIHEA